MTHNICFILLAVDKENNNDPLKIWGLYLFVLAFPGECVNHLGSEVKSIPERSAGWFKTLDVWHRLMLCDTSTGIDADASKGETSPGYFNSKLVHSYKCGTICPWEFPEISLAYSHIFLKGPSRPIIYGKIFWPPHIASPASLAFTIKINYPLFFGFPFI